MAQILTQASGGCKKENRRMGERERTAVTRASIQSTTLTQGTSASGDRAQESIRRQASVHPNPRCFLSSAPNLPMQQARAGYLGNEFSRCAASFLFTVRGAFSFLLGGRTPRAQWTRGSRRPGGDGIHHILNHPSSYATLYPYSRNPFAAWSLH